MYIHISNQIHKLFNKSKFKVSYITPQNMNQIISAHNRKLLNKLDPKPAKACSCRAETCPVEGRCQEEGTIYKATVTHKSPETGLLVKEEYVGLAATSFYKRHQNHKTTFKDRNHSTKSELSKHIWTLKDLDTSYILSWEILDKAQKFSPISKTCKLCTLERYYLICKPKSYTLNKKH